MVVATCVAGFASAWGLYGKQMAITEDFSLPIGNIALVALALLLIVGLVGFLAKQAEHRGEEQA